MSSPLEWLACFRPLLRVEARMLRLDPRLRKRFDSSDLVHETMLKAQENIGEFRGGSRPEMIRWLRQILHNKLCDLVEREHAQKRDVAREQSLNAAMAESSARLESILATPERSPGEQVEHQHYQLRLAYLLDNALEQLPEAQRDAVILHKLQGLSIKDIACRLDRTDKAVRLLLYHGLSRMRAMPELQQLVEEQS
jgi:RNA polymerase sigma-70 factor (ECF subfamily)